MGLFDRIFGSSYAHEALYHPHTPLHYIPSFNDMCTNANEDLELEELENEGRVPVKVVAAEVIVAEPVASDRGQLRSNKMDRDWPAFETTDIHKVNVSQHPRAKQHMYDMGRGPSVWEYIIKSEQLAGQNKDAQFRRMDQDRDGLVSADDLKRELRVSQVEAQRMLDEADLDRDGRISLVEYKEIVTHYGSE